VWTPYDNAGALGGKPISVTSLNACLMACYYGDRCSAAEWNAKNPLGRNCMLHSTPLPRESLLSSADTTRFQLDKPPNCPRESLYNAFRKIKFIKKAEYKCATVYNVGASHNNYVRKVGCVLMDVSDILIVLQLPLSG
jgi:hypothetical protein